MISYVSGCSCMIMGGMDAVTAGSIRMYHRVVSPNRRILGATCRTEQPKPAASRAIDTAPLNPPYLK